jgi:hypothetical protein
MIKLSEIVIGLATANNELESYYNPNTKEVFLSNIGEFEDLNEDELDELFEKSVMLPTKFDIHEYSIMEDFISTISDNLLHNQLLVAINGTAAFRRFKTTCINFGCIDNWYKFKDKKYKEIAAEWCKKNNVEYEDDVIC